jgi:hypothetical protein
MTTLHTQTFGTYTAAECFQKAFPWCGTCKQHVKIQRRGDVYRLECVKNPHHRDIRESWESEA